MTLGAYINCITAFRSGEIPETCQPSQSSQLQTCQPGKTQSSTSASISLPSSLSSFRPSGSAPMKHGKGFSPTCDDGAGTPPPPLVFQAPFAQRISTSHIELAAWRRIWIVFCDAKIICKCYLVPFWILLFKFQHGTFHLNEIQVIREWMGGWMDGWMRLPCDAAMFCTRRRRWTQSRRRFLFDVPFNDLQVPIHEKLWKFFVKTWVFPKIGVGPPNHPF